jgi:hypothetical protein
MDKENYPWLTKNDDVRPFNTLDKRRKYMEWLGNILDYTQISDWYQVTQNDFKKNKGVSMLILYYNKTVILALRDIFSKVEWYEWMFKRVPRDFWSNEENHRKYINWLEQKLSYKNIEDWYNINNTILSDNYGSGFLMQHNSSAIQIVKKFYPNHEWYEWKFKEGVPMYFWNNFNNHIKYINWLKKELNYESIEDFYKLTITIVENNYGCGIMCHYYNGSPINLLKKVYPEYEWKEWLFIQSPKYFWDTKINQLRYIKWLFDKLNLKNIEDWYTTSHRDFSNNCGSNFLKRFKCSYVNAIIELYPEYNWNKKLFKFSNYSQMCIDWLKYIENKNNIYIQHSEKEGEFRISKTKYKVDGYCKDTNTVYEFNGCFFHGCIKCYKNQDEINPKLKKTYKQLYDFTQKRKQEIINLGYNFEEIWECEYLELKL